MKSKMDINEDEIRVIGSTTSRPRKLWWLWCLIAAAMVAVVVLVVVLQSEGKETSISPMPLEITPDQPAVVQPEDIWLTNTEDELPSSVVKTDTTIDTISLTILTPINACPELYVGHLDENDTNILLATMAADIRRDNGKIVGAFVCAGEPLSWGLSKLGYCAIFDEKIAIGIAENSPLFEQATECGGYFFRQYPSVKGGVAVANNPENSAMRRALCKIGSRYCVVTTMQRVLMNDFSIALAKLGVDEAIFLVGGNAHGWWYDNEGKKHHFSQENSLNKRSKFMNYILFRKSYSD